MVLIADIDKRAVGFDATQPKCADERFALEILIIDRVVHMVCTQCQELISDYIDGLLELGEQTNVNQRFDLLLLTRSYMYRATQSGMPIRRSLIFELPTDANLDDPWDGYLFGCDILVAPLVTTGAARTAKFIFPLAAG